MHACFLKAWILGSSSFWRGDTRTLSYFSGPRTQSYQWWFSCILSCSYLLETTLWNAWWALFFRLLWSVYCLMLSSHIPLMFWASFKVVNFGWDLLCLQVWCATRYWGSVFILETRKAIKTFLILSSLFCRHVCRTLQYFIQVFFFQYFYVKIFSDSILNVRYSLFLH